MAGAGDLALLRTWLSDPRVLEWYEGRDKPYDDAKVAKEFGPGGENESDGVLMAIIEAAGQPVGYMQYYRVQPWAAEYELTEAETAATWGVDMFIGEPGRWSGGIGSAALRALVSHLFAERGADRVVIDPRVVNERAVRCYEKAGFLKVKILCEHEEHEGQKWDNWLMETRPGPRTAHYGVKRSG
jgi:aminoglycoside 6'-N-acetyltransferase